MPQRTATPELPTSVSVVPSGGRDTAETTHETGESQRAGVTIWCQKRRVVVDRKRHDSVPDFVEQDVRERSIRVPHQNVDDRQLSQGMPGDPGHEMAGAGSGGEGSFRRNRSTQERRLDVQVPGRATPSGSGRHPGQPRRREEQRGHYLGFDVGMSGDPRDRRQALHEPLSPIGGSAYLVSGGSSRAR